MRNPLYDIARGLGIILVVYGHSGIEWGHYIIYMFHMPLFFFISGCLYYPKRVGVGLKKKIIALGKPYIFFYIFAIVVDLLINGICDLYSRSAGPLWFLVCLFNVYFLYLLLSKVIFSNYLVICSLVFSLIGYILSIKNISLPLYWDTTLSVFLFYTLGTCLKKYMENIPKSLIINFLVTIFSLIGIYISYLVAYKKLHLKVNDLYINQIMGNYIMYVVASSIGIVSIMTMSTLLLRFSSKFLNYLIYIGKNSLFIFGLHMPILNICQYLYPSTSGIICLLYIFISILFSLVLMKLFLWKIPCLIK